MRRRRCGARDRFRHSNPRAPIPTGLAGMSAMRVSHALGTRSARAGRRTRTHPPLGRSRLSSRGEFDLPLPRAPRGGPGVASRGRVARPRGRARRARRRPHRGSSGARSRGEKHPIWDFLFTYYSYKPAVLRRWHPGAGVELEDAAAEPRARWRWYAPGSARGSLVVDACGVRAREARVARADRAHPPQHRGTPGFVRLLRAARMGDGLPAGRAPAPRAAAARPGRHRRGGRGARAALHPLRRVPLLHARRGAAQPLRPTREAAAGDWSSPGACTPAWTSTSGR